MNRLNELSLAAYSETRGGYWAVIYDNVEQYLTGTSASTAYKNSVKKTMVNSFNKAAEGGWADGFPIDREVPPFGDTENQILTAEINTELANIDLLFARLSELRKGGEFDAVHEAYARADGYCKTLDRIYNDFKVRAAGAKMLTFVGQDGTPPNYTCAECKRLKNKRHKASWWISHGLIPTFGNTNFTCGCYRSQHVLVDDNVSIFTL